MSIGSVARVLAKECDESTLAGIISALLCCEDNEDLTDDEAECGQVLWDCLVELVPESTITLAQSL